MGNQAVSGIREEAPAPTVVRTDEEWRAVLKPDVHRIARGGQTEPAWSGEYNACKEVGVYACMCCGTGLFKSQDKFDSGSGWPSFSRVSVHCVVAGEWCWLVRRSASKLPLCGCAVVALLQVVAGVMKLAVILTDSSRS